MKELKILDEAKSQFMVLINHELKTPLTVMTSFLDLLKESEINTEQKKYIQRIESSCQRLNNLIQDSLELISAEMQQHPVEKTKVDLVDVLNQAWGKLEKQADAKGLKFRASESTFKVQTDRTIMENVLHRLLDNAVKFAEEKSQVLCEFKLEKTYVEMSLQNKGPAPKPEVIEKILKPFTLDENIMHHSRGTGLGLSICQAQLKRLGLSMQIDVLKDHFVVRIAFPTGPESAKK